MNCFKNKDISKKSLKISSNVYNPTKNSPQKKKLQINSKEYKICDFENNENGEILITQNRSLSEEPKKNKMVENSLFFFCNNDEEGSINEEIEDPLEEPELMLLMMERFKDCDCCQGDVYRCKNETCQLLGSCYCFVQAEIERKEIEKEIKKGLEMIVDDDDEF